MALLGVGPAPPTRLYGVFPPPIEGYNFGRRGRDDQEQYYHHVVGAGGGIAPVHPSVAKQHAIQEKFNYIKHLLREKFYKNQNRGGHYEHSSKGESKDQSAAVSALTLLAFLFFLYILQSCIKEHMNQIMAAEMTTTTPAPTFFRRQSRKGETNDYEYESTEEESVELPKRQHMHRTSSALQVYKENPFESSYKHMEPVPLIIKP